MLVHLLSLLVMAASLSTHAAAPSNWDWVSPLPHRQDWQKIVAGPDGFVGITDGLGGRSLYHSADGKNWERPALPTKERIWSIAYVNGEYLALGTGATVLTSADGADWKLRHTDPAGMLLGSIAYGNGVYVALGSGPAMMVSSNLTDWTELREFGTGFSFSALEFGNGFFLAIGQYGNNFRSTDGKTWTRATWPEGLDYPGQIAFNNGVFACKFGSKVATTADGVNWNISAVENCGSISATEDGFIGCTLGAVMTSPDGLTWRTNFVAPLAPEYRYLLTASKSRDRWVAAGQVGALYVSADGGNWENVVNSIDYSWPSVDFANGAFIRHGSKPGHFVSMDGENWQFNPAGPSLSSVAGGNGVSVAVTRSGTIVVSSDSINWETAVTPAKTYGQILSANGLFMTPAADGVMVSRDGRAWEQISISGARYHVVLGYQNGVFAGFAEGNKPITSPDGRNWTIHPEQPDMAAQYYAAGNGRFVGIRGGGMGWGTVVWSTDGIHWTTQRLGSGATHIYTTLEFGGGYFLMTDDYGEVHYSTDGINWRGERQAPQRFTASAYGNGTWVLLGGDSILRTIPSALARSVATLQLKQQNFSTWNLLVTGSPGETFQIESTADLTARWNPLQTIQLPSSGQITVPVTSGAEPNAFYRAVSQPPQ